MNKTAKCVCCGKRHQVLNTFLDYVNVMLCTLITDLIYLNGVTMPKDIRIVIKNELGL